MTTLSAIRKAGLPSALLAFGAVYPSASMSQQSVVVRAAQNLTADTTNDQWSANVDQQRVVWTDRRNGAADIWLYDLASHIETKITPPSYSGAYGGPIAIDGDRIAYLDCRGTGCDGVMNTDVFVLDLLTGNETQITATPYQEGRPDLSGDRVTWSDSRDGAGSDIYVYDLSTGLETAVTAKTVSAWDPRIDGDLVIWREWSGIYAFDLSAGTETFVSAEFSGDATDHHVLGNAVVWTAMDYNSSPVAQQVFRRELPGGAIEQLSFAPAGAFAPKLTSTNAVIWGASGDLWRYDLATGTLERQTWSQEASHHDTSGDVVVWDEVDTSTGSAIRDIWTMERIATAQPTIDMLDGQYDTFLHAGLIVREGKMPEHLAGARAALDAGDTAGAIAHLDDFKAEVLKKTPRDVDPEASALLVEITDALIAFLLTP